MNQVNNPPAPSPCLVTVISDFVSDGKFDIERFRSLPLPDEQQLLASWGERRTPLVSILCITYNHRHFVEDTIRGLLLQKTDFPFEIIVHDDASTDGTSAIVAEWQRRYPAVIKHVQQDINLYSKGASPSAIALEYSKGDFICICEGDDFWVDERKLQIQAQSLLADDKFAVSYHNAIVIDENRNVLSMSQLKDRFKVDQPAKALLMAEVWILNLTRMIRRSACHFPPELFRTLNRDRFLISMIGNHGGAKYEHELQPAVYRAHGGGVWSQLDAQAKVEERISTSFWLCRYYERIGKPVVARRFETTFLKYVTQRYSIFHMLLSILLRASVFRKLHLYFMRDDFD